MDRANVNDPTESMNTHPGQDGASHQECAFQHDIDEQIPFSERKLLDLADVLQSGIIDKGVNACFASVLQASLDVLFGRHIQGISLCLASQGFNLRYSLLSARQIYVGSHDRMPLLRQANTQATAQAAPCPGDQNHAFEQSH